MTDRRLRTDPAHAALLARLEQTVMRQPGDAAAHAERGRLLTALGRHLEAFAAFETALGLDPRLAQAFSGLGLLLARMDRPGDASKAINRALQLAPNHPEAHHDLGTLLALYGQWPQAIQAFERALALDPARGETLLALGLARHRLGDPTGARESLEAALRLDPGDAEALTALGDLLLDLEQFEAAFDHHQRALRLAPNDPLVHSNLGKAQQRVGRMDAALACFDQALALDPKGARWRLNRAFLLLLTGRFAEGWAEHEARWLTDQARPFRRQFSQPRWAGEPLAGRTLLLFAEQGLGDAIQMVRFLPWAQGLGGRILLECPAALADLFAAQGWPIQVIVQGDPLPTFDCWLPLFSLPLLHGAEPGSIPGAAGYLTPPPGPAPSAPSASPVPLASSASSLPHAGSDRPPRIGLVWRGSPGHPLDRLRSIDAALLEPLIAASPDCAFVSLQVGDAAAELDRFGWASAIQRPLPANPAEADMAATARLVASLDLVICVDTAIAHLAGALGRPVWVLIPYAPDWRWLLEREDSPWYASMRLFRQGFGEKWAAVLARAAAALRARQA